MQSKKSMKQKNKEIIKLGDAVLSSHKIICNSCKKKEKLHESHLYTSDEAYETFFEEGWRTDFSDAGTFFWSKALCPGCIKKRNKKSQTNEKKQKQ